MKFKSQLVTQASGSIGGATFSRNAGGMYIRARSIPVNTNTAQQQAVRNNLAQLASRWGNVLTPAQRFAWETYAQNTPLTDSLGEPRPVSGLAMYIRGNAPRIQAGLTIVDDGPIVFGLPSNGGQFFASDEPNQEVDVTFIESDAWVDIDDGGLSVLISRPTSPTINYFAGPYRFAGLIAGDSTTPPTSPAAIAVPFPISPGQRIHIQTRVLDARGRISSPFRGSIDVA